MSADTHAPATTPPTARAVREQIVAVCRELLAAALTRGTSGNVSARVAGGMLITPSAVPYPELEPDMLQYVPFQAPPASDANAGLRPSTEWRMHAGILQARADVNAIVHAHPPYATALACLRRSIPPFHYMVAVAGGNDIRCADYATFGSAGLAAAALEALQQRTACLLANHGIIALGDSPLHALALAVEVEALAEQYTHALTIGVPVLLTDAQMAEVQRAFQDYRRTGP